MWICLKLHLIIMNKMRNNEQKALLCARHKNNGAPPSTRCKKKYVGMESLAVWKKKPNSLLKWGSGGMWLPFFHHIYWLGFRSWECGCECVCVSVFEPTNVRLLLELIHAPTQASAFVAPANEWKSFSVRPRWSTASIVGVLARYVSHAYETLYIACSSWKWLERIKKEMWNVNAAHTQPNDHDFDCWKLEKWKRMRNGTPDHRLQWFVYFLHVLEKWAAARTTRWEEKKTWN